MTKRPKRRVIAVGFRMTKNEVRQVESHRLPDELFSECCRRLLLAATVAPRPTRVSR